MKPELENLNEYTSKLSLTSEEKFDMFQNIRAYSNAHPVRSKYSIFMKHSFVYTSMLALLIGTAGTSIAAEDALPGDILYSVKTNINEEVFKTLSFSETQKAKVAVNRMDKRMEELEKMIVQKKDSPEKIDIIVAKLSEHKEDLQDFTNQVELSNTEEVREATEIYATLDSVIDTHIDILEEIKTDQEKELGIAQAPDTIVTKEVSPMTSSDEASDSTNVVLTMNARVAEAPDPITATSIATATPTPIDPNIAGEQDAIDHIMNFSVELDPLITSKNVSTDVPSPDTEQLKSDTRKRIIEKAEEELQIEVEENTTIEIQTIIK